MIKKNISGVCMIEFDLGELYSYLELFNKVYGGYEKEVDILLAAVLDVFKIEHSPNGTAEALSALRNNRGAGRKPAITDDQKREVSRLRGCGHSLRQISDHTGISRSSVQRILAKEKQRVSRN